MIASMMVGGLGTAACQQGQEILTHAWLCAVTATLICTQEALADKEKRIATLSAQLAEASRAAEAEASCAATAHQAELDAAAERAAALESELDARELALAEASEAAERLQGEVDELR